MIHLFNSRARVLFFPIRWANSVARWILGLHSNSGTIRVKNSANPNESGGASIDVDMERVSGDIKDRLAGHFQTKRDVEATICRSIDGSSLISRDRKILISEDWLRQRLGETGGSTTESSDVTFKLEAVKNSGGSVTGMKVYIADTDAIVVRGKSYSLPTGTVVGWNNIGRTGALYINQKSVGSSETVTSQSPDNTPGLFSIYIGSVTANGVVQHTLGKIYTPATSNDYFNDDFFYGGNGLGQNNDNGSLSSGADTLDMRSWTRGTTDYVTMSGSNRVSDPRWTTQLDGFGNTIKPGVTLRVCTRVFRGSYDGQNDAFFFREMKFDKDGCLYSISPEIECFMEHNKGWSEFL